MRGVLRAAIIVVALVCALGATWVFRGPAASNVVVDNANVAGGIAGLLALLVTVVLLWPRAADRRASAASATAELAQAAADYLAVETLRYWRNQAKDRRITTPSPVTVRWRWASDKVAVPARELHSCTAVLTAGVITQLREQLYDRLGPDQVRIVLLGEAGAGKTAAMLLLLIDILKHRPMGSPEPVPVWLTMGGWNPATTTLQDWAAATLRRDYRGLAAPEHGGPATAVRLVQTGRVALFLDGLDEMPPDVQSTALQAIDRDTTGLRVVLTSRPEPYRTALAQGRLYGTAVIDLLPVNVDQAEEFLLAEQLSDRRHAWQHVIDHIRTHPDSPAARALTTPLALSLARDTYTTANPTDLLDADRHRTPDALLQHLLTQSLTLAYPDPAQRAHATYWLSWIAQHMGTNRDLRWWDIPTWVPRQQRVLAFRLVGGLAIGLAIGLMFGLAFGLMVGLIGGVVGGLIVGFAIGLRGLMDHRPHRVTVRWPTRQEWRFILTRPEVSGLTFGLVSGLTFVLVSGLAFGLVSVLTFGLAIVLAVELTVRLVQVWSTPLATVRTASPLEVYRAGRRRTLAFGLAGLGVVPVFGLAIVLEIGLAGILLAIGLASGLEIVLAIARIGVGPVLQLAMVEAIWGLRLKRVRFMPLLETALHKQVLRQAGTVYQFRHAALQDHLATRDISTPNT